MWVQSLGKKDFLEEEKATHFSILAWEIPLTEEPGGLQYMGSQRIGYNLVTKQQKQNIFVQEILGVVTCYSRLGPRGRA